jgi:hypothetical protein
MKFNPKSRQAIQGMKFQDEVLQDLTQAFAEVIPVRDYLLAIDPCLSSQQLNFLEQTFGDIVVKQSPTSDPIFVECVSLGYENSRFPESKVKKFIGDNKFYAFGWENETTKFIPSATWNAYARKLEDFFMYGRQYRKFSRGNIRSVRKADVGTESFKGSLEAAHEGG